MYVLGGTISYVHIFDHYSTITVISTLLNFVTLFRRAHQENCKQAELERKKAEKEAEMEKSKAPNSTNKKVHYLL